MSKLEVTKADVSERSRCITAHVLAYAADPLLRWILPDPARYLAFFPRVMQHYAGRAFEHGSAYRASDCTGSALWLPPNVGLDEEALGLVMQEAVESSRLQEVFGLLEAVTRAHPREPHWFLPLIGVDPLLQGGGIGSALLTQSLGVIDGDHAVAYLEASNPRNVPFFQRFGFEPTGEVQLGSSPVIVPMVRTAR